MSAVEQTIAARPAVKRKSAPIVNRFIDFVSSVRCGVVQLCILVVLAMIGMLIVQQNVQGFDTFYAGLTPAEKTVYGTLGFFDIYKSWYFNLLLLTLSLNIVLASIDRFPSAWSYIGKPKLWATKKWLQAQTSTATMDIAALDRDNVAERIAAAYKKNGLKPRIAEKDGKFFVFGESGRYNRIGAYIVHVALLTLFLGHFVALQTGFDADVRMIPGDRTDAIQMIRFNLDKKEKYNVQIPFTITCTDIQQTLINPNGAIGVDNTMDWRTQIRIDDPAYGSVTADVSMNQPFTYRGYRFFQAQTVPVGNARIVNIELTPQKGGDPVRLQIPRAGSTTMADGTLVEYADFQPDFTFNSEGKPDTKSSEYRNPVAVLNVTPPGGERTRVFAFGRKVADNIPVGAPKLGYRWRLGEFEKAPFAHVLSIKYDPYNAALVAWYGGGFGLIFALIFVFFFSHKRIWALVEESSAGVYEVTLGGHTNRNQVGFVEKFDKVAAELRG